jgi:hypothetical protein
MIRMIMVSTHSVTAGRKAILHSCAGAADLAPSFSCPMSRYVSDIPLPERLEEHEEDKQKWQLERRGISEAASFPCRWLWAIRDCGSALSRLFYR